MKNKKMIVRISAVLFLIIAVFSIVLRANTNKKISVQPTLTFAPSDTLKPEVLQEKRITKIEIINGKKKIIDKVIKMKGDSIVEEKITEREEDIDENSEIDPQIHGFYFNQNDPMDIDSMFGMNFRQFDFDPFNNDSIFKSFGFDINPGFHMRFGDSFMDDDIFKNFHDFFQGQMNPNFDNRFEEFFKNRNFKFPNPDINRKNHSEKKFKSLKEIIRDQLLNDEFIKDINDNFRFEINEKKLKINGKKQSRELYNRYKNLIKDNSGLELEGEFEYKFKNNKSLKKGMRML